MKNQLLLLGLFLGVFSQIFGQSDSLSIKMAKTYCTCMDAKTSSLSSETKAIIGQKHADGIATDIILIEAINQNEKDQKPISASFSDFEKNNNTCKKELFEMYQKDFSEMNEEAAYQSMLIELKNSKTGKFHLAIKNHLIAQKIIDDQLKAEQDKNKKSQQREEIIEPTQKK